MTAQQKFVYSAIGAEGGQELWISDGTDAGTRLLKEIAPGAASSSPVDFTAMADGRVLFRANTDVSGNELWVTDGTEEGTVLVKDIFPGTTASTPMAFAPMEDGRVLFTATDGTHGHELWVTDGTEAGTFMLKDIYAGSTGSSPTAFAALGDGRMVFGADDGTNGREVWVTDGTEAGTFMLKDVYAGSTGSSPYMLVSMGDGRVMFSAVDPVNGFELWATDGTEAGTSLVKDIYPGVNSGVSSFSMSQGLVSLGDGRAVFSATDGVNGYELWVSDGTEAGTFMLKDIYAGSGSSMNIGMGLYQNPIVTLEPGRAIFSAYDPATGYELWVTDGTEAGTQRVKDIYPGSGSGLQAYSTSPMVALGDGRALFNATDGVNGYELWVTDGTEAGTFMLKDIAVGSDSGYPQQMKLMPDGRVVFTATDSVHGTEVWITDGTEAGTYMVQDSTSGTDYTNAYGFTPIAGNAAPVGVPVVTGTVAQGGTLNADVSGISDADGLGAFTYRWQRDNGSGSYTDIVDATDASYTLTQADVGYAVRLVASYTDGLGKVEEVISLASAPVANVNDAPVGVPVVTGTMAQGGTLNADVSGISDVDGVGAFTYRWQREDGAGGYTDIADATEDSYTLTQADVGRAVRVVVSYTDGQGTPEEVMSLASPPVANTNDAPVGAPLVAGLAEQGQVLTAGVTGISDADGVGAFTYRWQREDGAGGYADIADATEASYTLTQADVGHGVRVVVSYTDGQGSAEQVMSLVSAPVANVNDAPEGALVVSGTAQRGETLSVANMVSDADGMGEAIFRWERDDGEGNFVTIEGATGKSYELTRDDIGHTVRVTISYTDDLGTPEELSSAATAVVTPRSIEVATPDGGVSHTLGLTSGDIAARLAEGDVLRPEDGTQVVQIADGRINFDAAGDAAFLSRLYGGLLDRAGEQQGLSYWAHQGDGPLDRVAVAEGFLMSEEYRAKALETDDAQFVRHLFQDLLSRDAEEEGLNYFLGRLEDGASRAQIVVDIAGSAEAGGNWSGEWANGLFVADEFAGLIRAAYQAAFGREAEAGGLSFHGGTLEHGVSLSEWGDMIESSSEFQALHGEQGDHEFVESLFVNGLGREGSAEDVAYFENLLAEGSHDRGDLVMAFATSQEAQNGLHWAL